MNSSLIQLLVLAGVAVFLILKLRAVLGTREGFEKPNVVPEPVRPNLKSVPTVVDGEDHDITDNVPARSAAASALAAMKAAEPSFAVGEFLRGARSAYEMILMAFEHGEIEKIRPFLADEVEASFEQAINSRDRIGKITEAKFLGIREMTLTEAEFDQASRTAEITIRFTGELTSVTRDTSGTVVEGSPTEVKRQRDAWTFSRRMGVQDPNWQLVATGD